jgi:hypothetical protein
MDAADLKVFAAVARIGGMNRAANELHTVQSNVTARVRTLEEELGVQLFHRGRKGVTLTAAGERLLPYAIKVAHLLEEAQKAVKDDGKPRGSLTIGSVETTVYCRRWGVPLIDGGTVRLPRIVGQGRALEIILTGRKVPAEECLIIGLCEYVTPKGRARQKAEELAKEIARFPQTCVRADRRSAIKSNGLSVREALIQEWHNGREALIEDGVAGASRFKDGFGRHGDFARI